MLRILTSVAFAALMTGSALAAGATCSTAPAAQFKPQADLISQLKTEGLTVKKIKVENGCYEVYAVNAAGKKLNMAYNAETLEKLDKAEAGEN